MAIEGNDLAGIGRRVWAAVVPPITHISVVAALLLFILGFDSFSDSLFFSSPKLLPSSGAREVLEFYGFSDVAPVVFGVLLLALAHGVQNGLASLGSRMPPYLTSNTTVQMRAAADGWTLQRLWAAHPEFDAVQSLNMLNVATDEAINQAELDPKSHHRFRQVVRIRDRGVFHRTQIDFSKGVLAATIATGVTAAIVQREVAVLGRTSLVVLLAASWLFYQATRLVEAEHAYYRAKVQTYLDVQEISAAKPLVPHVSHSDRDRERLRDLSMWLEHTPMWSVEWSVGRRDVVGREEIWEAIKRAMPTAAARRKRAAEEGIADYDDAG